jgi:hypothetical protein
MVVLESLRKRGPAVRRRGDGGHQTRYVERMNTEETKSAATEPDLVATEVDDFE